MIPFPDVSALSPDLAAAIVRMVRLVNEMRRRHPDLDRFAISTETEIVRLAAGFVGSWVERQGLDFSLMISPWDGRQVKRGEPPFTSGNPGDSDTRER